MRGRGRRSPVARRRRAVIARAVETEDRAGAACVTSRPRASVNAAIVMTMSSHRDVEVVAQRRFDATSRS